MRIINMTSCSFFPLQTRQRLKVVTAPYLASRYWFLNIILHYKETELLRETSDCSLKQEKSMVSQTILHSKVRIHSLTNNAFMQKELRGMLGGASNALPGDHLSTKKNNVCNLL